MSKLRATMSISLDGYGAGPDQSLEEPLGVGGEHLHDWMFPLAYLPPTSGKAQHPISASDPTRLPSESTHRARVGKIL